MAQTPEFIPSANFTESGVTGADLDTVFAEAKATIDGLTENAEAIQRDDQKLANGSVHAQALSGQALALINGTFDYTGVFSSGTEYTVGQSYFSSGRLYLVLLIHVASSVSADEVVGNVVAVTTSEDAIPNTGLVTSLMSGSSSSYIFSLNLTAYNDGENYNLIPNHTNTGAATINRDSQGAKPLLVNGRGALPGEVVSGRKIQVAYTESLDSWELMSPIPRNVVNSSVNSLNILVTSDTAFNVVVRSATLKNGAGGFVLIGDNSLSIALASAVMNGSYAYDNDKWYDVYILSNGSGSFQVELVPDGSALVENSSHPYSVRAGCLRNTGGNLVRTHQTGNQVRFLQNISQRAVGVLDSATGLESVSLTVPVDVSQVELCISGAISGVVTSELIIAQGSELLESQVFKLTAGCTDSTVVRYFYARNDSSVRKVDIKYSTGSANTVSVFICGFIWR